MTNTPTPTGRLVPTGDGHDLVLTRILPGSLDDAWAGVTEPERTARWIGRWEGTGAVGETIKLRLGFEDDAPVSDVKITECAAPHRLRVLTIDESGSWDVSLTLAPVGERTELTFTMHRVDPAVIGEIGPGWEYYLDQLVAASSGAPLPDFDAYYPAQQAYFQALAAD
ncbi:MAG TPA: SRPBCC family protein [Microlunatus sp.]|nr:SRPBCC family protein [Microlunatus sp.]